MTGTTELRAAITGLIGLAAAEEEMLLASAPNGEDGSADRWAAAPLVAHNAEFRQQQECGCRRSCAVARHPISPRPTTGRRTPTGATGPGPRLR